MRNERNNFNPNFTLVAQNMEYFHKVAKKYMTGYFADFAEDAAQSSILKALKKIDSFSPSRSKFTTWAYELVKNTCLDMKKKKGAVLTVDGNLNENAGGLYFFDHGLDEKTKFKQLRAAILELNTRDKELILLKVKFKCSAREMSQFTGIPEKNINCFMMRAKLNLKAKLITANFCY